MYVMDIMQLPTKSKLTPHGLQCVMLQAGLGDAVLFPDNTRYENFQCGVPGYWSQQAADPKPSCRVLAMCAADVAFAVTLLSRYSCTFAVRSGGHMSWAGAANIDNGVTIDLSAINQVDMTSNGTIVSVGSGARWLDVSLKLDSMNLAVVGGRVSEVGVGGLVTGGKNPSFHHAFRMLTISYAGGNSFFAARYGFACDNVENFEVGGLYLRLVVYCAYGTV